MGDMITLVSCLSEFILGEMDLKRRTFTANKLAG